MFYSKTTGGFYDEAIHGARLQSIIDPAWQHPTIEIADPKWDFEAHPEETPLMIEVLDPAAIPPTIEVANPYCKIPVDAVEITVEEHATLLAAQSAGKIIQADNIGRPVAVDPPAPTIDEIRRQLTAAVQAHLDAIASSRGYDGILSLATYATSTNAKFAAEGQAGVQWRDAVWAHCWQVMANVEAGQCEIPTAEALIAELPAMVWP